MASRGLSVPVPVLLNITSGLVTGEEAAGGENNLLGVPAGPLVLVPTLALVSVVTVTGERPINRDKSPPVERTLKPRSGDGFPSLL